MVLPASTADEGQAREPAWLDRLRGILELSRESGVLALVPDAKQAQLLPLMRTLWAIDANARLVVDASTLRDTQVGELIVLALREPDARWLNYHRPLFADRKLRVVLWGETAVVTAMLGRAPDFLDWVSHVVECPFGVPEFTVRGLRAGVDWGRIAWGGGLDLREVLDHLAWEFEELQTGQLRLLDTSTLILNEPAGETPGWFPVDARQVPLDAFEGTNLPLDIIIRVEAEAAAVGLLREQPREERGPDEELDDYVLRLAKRSRMWPELREQALTMRASGPVVRAWFKAEPLAFSVSQAAQDRLLGLTHDAAERADSQVDQVDQVARDLYEGRIERGFERLPNWRSVAGEQLDGLTRQLIVLGLRMLGRSLEAAAAIDAWTKAGLVTAAEFEFDQPREWLAGVIKWSSGPG
jgi:hypothetical protein